MDKKNLMSQNPIKKEKDSTPLLKFLWNGSVILITVDFDDNRVLLFLKVPFPEWSQEDSTAMVHLKEKVCGFSKSLHFSTLVFIFLTYKMAELLTRQSSVATTSKSKIWTAKGISIQSLHYRHWKRQKYAKSLVLPDSYKDKVPVC